MTNPAPTDSAAADIVRDLAKTALEKRRKGKTPTARELSALRKIEKDREEKAREHHYLTVPLHQWRKWSGRQNKIIYEQGRRFGLPIAQAVISLPEFVCALHDFFDRYKFKLAIDAPAMDEVDLRLRTAKAEREELRLARDRGQVVPIEERDTDEIALVRWFVGVMERAGPELAPRIAGRRTADVKTICKAYFDALRLEAVGKGRQKPSKKAGKPTSKRSAKGKRRKIG